MSKTAAHIAVSGRVQGVGFRPFVYRFAGELGLNGWVRNFTGGVEIHIEGSDEECRRFTNLLKEKAPRASVIRSVEAEKTPCLEIQGFAIRSSRNDSADITDISPDIAVCPECLDDMVKQKRRQNYPFTNCTHCGPRFSITCEIPYDRKKTTMRDFSMCTHCQKEYVDVSDRRFHAQPVSCRMCGPEYAYITGDATETDFENALYKLADAIQKGKIVAVKGTGGFHLICDAMDNEAVRRLRNCKKRYSKAFAVMFRDMQTLKKYARAGKIESEMLQSWRRPVSILESIQELSYEVNKGYSSYGAVLPYTPLQHLLMKVLDLPAIVFTSANKKSHPLTADNKEALSLLKEDICDGVMLHNRDIKNKTDDSVVKLVAGDAIIIRRARGYVPEPVMMNQAVEGILAMGADMKSSFCIGKGKKAIQSQYIGDLDDYDVFRHYRKTINDFKNLFHFEPSFIVYDSHPDYHSSREAQQMITILSGRQNSCEVQHHHAHIASVMAEHGLDEKVIGVAMDGSGYGDDGKIWGSEIFINDLETYQSICHLPYIPLPGGDKAVKEPWRTAVAVLYDIYGTDYLQLPLDIHKQIPREKQEPIIRATEKGINLYESRGMGRLFDTVAALLNLVHRADFEGEAPVKLEEIAGVSDKAYKLSGKELQYEPVIRQIVADITAGVPANIISGRFHKTIVNMICEATEKTAKASGLNKVILSGGTFQNKIITEQTISILKKKGFSIFINRKVPCNDGGISLGQIAIAAKKRSLCV